MGVIAWVATALALWHFAIFIPDRFWSGIVGSFLFAVVGGVLSGFVLSGLTVPGNDDITVASALAALPGAALGLAAAYGIGVRQGNEALHL